jgi:pSer/pThr/pTyr-binding forkhead associated (FHA) protein
MVYSAPQPNEEYPTQSWLAGKLAGAYHLTPDDIAAVTELRGGTAMLVGIGGPTVGSRVLIWRDEVAVGRGEDCPIWLSSGTVSRHHASFVRTADGYDVCDAGSLNGTYVNNMLATRVSLHQGDEIRFGSCRFLYFAGQDPTA